MTTHQQVFDFVVSRALAQNARCGEGSNCFYRSQGKKCFAGFLIPDDVYDRKMEGKSIAGVVNDWRKHLGHLAPVITLLKLLQLMHDHTPDTREWPRMFGRLGADLGLDTGDLPVTDYMPTDKTVQSIYACYVAQIRNEIAGEKVGDPDYVSMMTFTANGPVVTPAPLPPVPLAEATKIVAQSKAMQKMLADIYDLGKPVTLTLRTGDGGPGLQPGWLSKELEKVT